MCIYHFITFERVIHYFIFQNLETGVIKNIKTSIANSIKKNGYSLLEIDYFLDELSYDLKSKINMEIESYGLEITELSISNILYPTPQENPLFDEMRKQYGQENIIKKEKNLTVLIKKQKVKPNW